jgi:hypothetical protein
LLERRRPAADEALDHRHGLGDLAALAQGREFAELRIECRRRRLRLRRWRRLRRGLGCAGGP